MRRATTTLLIATLSMAAAPPAAAQQGAAEIRGRVLDAHEGLLPGATVVLRNQQTGMFRQVVSSAEGIYFLSGVAPAVYELSAKLAGFKRYSRRGVRLEVGKTATVDIGLEVGGLDEQLTFAFLQDASLTPKDFFAKQNSLPKPDTTFQQYGFTLGGPMMRDKVHFFASVERLSIDDARTLNIPARPDLNATPTTQSRIWNTLVRFDHQIAAVTPGTCAGCGSTRCSSTRSPPAAA